MKADLFRIDTNLNPLGHIRKFIHSATGELATFTDEVGLSISMVYNTNGQRASVTDRRGGVTRWGYHTPSGKVSALTNANGAVFRSEFAPRTNSGIVFDDTSRITYPDGATEEFSYDSVGNALSRKDREGKVWRMTYNDHGQVLTVTNPLGGVVTYTYNPDGTVASRFDSDTALVRFSYDQFRRMTNVTRADGSTVGSSYDANDRVLSVKDERENTYQYRYDANDNLLEVIDPNKNSTRYSYDSRDRLATVTDRLGEITRFAYDPLENLAATTNRNGNAVTLEHDALQCMTGLIDPAGKRWSFSYDPEGVVKTWGNPLNESQSQTSDAMGFPVAYTNALGRTRIMHRNDLQLVTETIDELSRTNARTYDSRGLLTSLSKPVIGSARLQRNNLGEVTRLVDPSGHAWLWDHSPVGRVSVETDPLGQSTAFEYDSRGRLSLTTFADNTSRTNTYDARNNPVRAQFTDGTDLQFTFDALNRVTTANNLSLAYDAESRITNTIGFGIPFGASYDAGGRLITVSYNNGLFTVSYEYDSRDRLVRVADDLSGSEVSFTYDDAGRMTGLTRPNSRHGIYSYDAAGRVTRIQEGDFLDLNYTLDDAGQITQVNLRATLDPGLFVSRMGTTILTYDSAHQINSAGYQYDACGRMVAAPGQSFKYDGASRLTQIGSVTLVYNGFGDAVNRVENGTEARFFYNYAIGLGPIVAQQEPNRGFTRYYVWSPGGRLLYMIDPATRAATFFHFDRIGSTVALTDSTGTITDSYAYSPYGQLLWHQGNISQPFTYIGRYGVRSEGTNLYQMRARYYSANTGSFLTRDPVPPRMDDIHSFNPYQYVAGDPLRNVDAEGLDRTIWFFGHAWIEVDVYDAQGRVTGRLALNFAPESGKSDYQVIMPRNIVYPHLVGYDMKSSQLEDELLVAEWRRLQRDPNRGQQWNPLKNCIWRSIEYANADLPIPIDQAKKMIAQMPVRTDLVITAAPPGPWYKEAYYWASDNWSDFENWLQKALD